MAAAVIFTVAGILFWMKADRQKRSNSGHIRIETGLTGSNTAVIYPQNGWPAFEKYIAENIDSLAGNKPQQIILAFSTNQETAKPENVRILKSAGMATDKKVVEIIRNGPAWTNSEGKEVKIIIKVNNR
jgi:hypothetical protein